MSTEDQDVDLSSGKMDPEALQRMMLKQKSQQSKMSFLKLKKVRLPTVVCIGG